MSVTLASFRAEFEEFAGAPDAKVSAKIASAELRTPADVWGDLRDEGIKYLAAHLLVIDPRAKDMRKAGKADENRYLDERKSLERVVSSGFRVTGSS